MVETVLTYFAKNGNLGLAVFALLLFYVYKHYARIHVKDSREFKKEIFNKMDELAKAVVAQDTAKARALADQFKKNSDECQKRSKSVADKIGEYIGTTIDIQKNHDIKTERLIADLKNSLNLAFNEHKLDVGKNVTQALHNFDKIHSDGARDIHQISREISSFLSILPESVNKKLMETITTRGYRDEIR